MKNQLEIESKEIVHHWHDTKDDPRAKVVPEENATLANIYATLIQPISSKKPKPVLINPWGCADAENNFGEKNSAAKSPKNRPISQVFRCPNHVPS